MKKKQPQPAATPQKPPAPAKTAAPPQAKPAPQPAAGKKAAPEAATPTPGEQGKDLSEVPVQSAEKEPDSGPRAPLAPTLPKFQLTPPSLLQGADPIDWSAMQAPFTSHGVPLTLRDADQIRQNWSYTYNSLMRWGLGPDLSLKITNIGTAFAYDTALSHESPNVLEQFDKDTEKMLGPGKSLGKIVVPIITPDTLSWTVEKVTGKKLDFRF